MPCCNAELQRLRLKLRRRTSARQPARLRTLEARHEIEVVPDLSWDDPGTPNQYRSEPCSAAEQILEPPDLYTHETKAVLDRSRKTQW